MSEIERLYENLNVTKEGGEAVITAEIPLKIVEVFRREVLDRLKRETELPGFRKGHVPEKILIERAGEIHLLGEAAEEALKEIVPLIIREEKLDVLGRPEARFTKIALGNSVHFEVSVSLFPEVTLPDYKKIAKEASLEKKEITIEEKEVEEAIKEIRRIRLSGEKKEGVEEKLEELSEEEVKKIGNFSSVVDFKANLRKNLFDEKRKKEKERVRLLIMERVSKDTKVEIPKLLIESELDRMLSYFENDVRRIGITLEEYLKKTDKKIEDLRKEWRPDAENRVRFELILNKIGESENISASEEEISAEISHLAEHVADLNKKEARPYVAHQIRTQKTFEFLEDQK